MAAQRRSPDREKPAARARRALSHVGGTIAVTESGADQREVATLQRALAVTADEADVMAHVHGFHSYPARLHPQTARTLIEGLTTGKARVLDPFCGSGTVLVEARLSGRSGCGSDLNPLALELAWLKTRAFSSRDRERLLAAGSGVVQHAEARRKARAGPARRHPRIDRDLFDSHVLLELDGLASGLREVSEPELARALGLVLSSTLTKVSRQRSDTSRASTARRLASGFTIRLFANKLDELARRLGEFSAALPPRAPPVRLELGDARRLHHVRPRSVDLVVSSPPYPGVYDYVDHHATRLRWLGLDASALRRQELGARRELGRMPPRQAVLQWEGDLQCCLAELARVLAPRGRIALVIADSALGEIVLRADELVTRAAARSGLELLASASQARPHFHRPSARAFTRVPRREWLLLLGHGGKAPGERVALSP